MAVEIKVPALGESVTEATVAKWLVKAGDAVTIDQPLCDARRGRCSAVPPQRVPAKTRSPASFIIASAAPPNGP